MQADDKSIGLHDGKNMVVLYTRVFCKGFNREKQWNNWAFTTTHIEQKACYLKKKKRTCTITASTIFMLQKAI